jgi:hypothetical protein
MSIPQVLYQVHTIESLCNFLEQDAVRNLSYQIPVSMPPDIGSLGFDKTFWLLSERWVCGQPLTCMLQGTYLKSNGDARLAAATAWK